jgi:hypothetical protein
VQYYRRNKQNNKNIKPTNKLDQGLGDQKHHKYIVQYYQVYGESNKNKTTTNKLLKLRLVEKGLPVNYENSL